MLYMKHCVRQGQCHVWKRRHTWFNEWVLRFRPMRPRHGFTSPNAPKAWFHKNYNMMIKARKNIVMWPVEYWIQTLDPDFCLTSSFLSPFGWMDSDNCKVEEFKTPATKKLYENVINKCSFRCSMGSRVH